MNAHEFFELLTDEYIETAYYTDTGRYGQPDFDVELSHEAMWSIIVDARRFLAAIEERGVAWDMLDPETTGRDLWYTRNGYEVGFHIRTDLGGAIREILTEAAIDLGRVEMLQEDDGLGYFALAA